MKIESIMSPDLQLNVGDYWFPYFGPLLLRTKVSSEFTSKLLEEGNKSRENNLDYRHKLAGGIDNEYYFNDFEEWFMPRFESVLSLYSTQVSGLGWHTNRRINLPLKIRKSDLWINYQKAKEFNPPHKHDGDLSFVTYLQIPDEIKEENIRMKGVHHNTGAGTINFTFGESLPFSIGLYYELPEVGDTFIFPAWLNHYVNPFNSDVERISVAGNFYLERDEMDSDLPIER